MAALQCEICGGKLVGKPGGLFECEFCGMTFEKERVIQMVHEIKGTVKVEKTLRLEQNINQNINVSGSVKLEGAASAENFIKRGNLALSDRKWDDADRFFDQALNLDAENAEAYLGKYLAQRKIMSRRGLEFSYERNFYNPGTPGFSNQVRRIRKYAQGELAQWIKTNDEKIKSQKAALEKKIADDTVALVPVRERHNKVKNLIAVGYRHIVGVKSDGTVLAVGNNDHGQCNVENWTDIIAIKARGDRTVGLKADGTVVAVGENEHGECDVDDWSDIVAIAVGYAHTAGLKRDGTVVAVGRNESDCCNVSGWNHIVDIACGDRHTAGLRSDGSVVIQGDGYGLTDGDFVSISADGKDTYGIRRDGSDPRNGFTGVVDMLHGPFFVLKRDGSVEIGHSEPKWQELHTVFYGWKDIVAIAGAKLFGTIYVGLKSDGTVLAAGDTDSYGDPRGWRLFTDIETFDEECQRERPLARKRKMLEMNAQRRTELREEQIRVSTELKCLRGLFTGKRRKELEARLAEIETELKGL